MKDGLGGEITTVRYSRNKNLWLFNVADDSDEKLVIRNGNIVWKHGPCC